MGSAGTERLHPPSPAHAAGRYLPYIDGLRALAVLAVIAYHLDPA